MKSAQKTNFGSLDSKLKSYSALAVGVLAAGTAANAQIIYTDIDPDTIIADTFYLLDFDKDAIPDFNLTQVNYSYGSTSFLNLVGVQALNNNEVLGDTAIVQYSTSTDTAFFPKPLALNDDISANEKVWSGTTYGLLYMKISYYGNSLKDGKWKAGDEKYLGLRFKIGNDWHYGWVRIEIGNNAGSFKIKDFAYESTADKHILAGKTVSGIAEADLNLSIYTGSRHLFIKSPDSEAQAVIYNPTGQQLMSLEIKKGQNAFDLGSFPSGIYLLKIQSVGKEVTHKFILR